jgi:NAD(P)-dependent dehydrogenase (short-subunit alcohol dehydrogenase family)
MLAGHPVSLVTSCVASRNTVVMALFLASEDAGFITGVALPVDGGRTVLQRGRR